MVLISDLEDDDPVIARITAEKQQQKARLAGMLTQVVDTNPDAYAEKKRVADYMGFPTAAVEALPELTQRAKVQQLQESVADAPRLQQRIAEDEAFAKLAHDDTGTLASLERVGRNIGRAVTAALPQFNEGAYGAAQSATEFGAAILDPLVGNILPANPLAMMADAAARQRANEKATRTALEKARGQNGATEDAVYSGIQSATSAMLSVPLAILTRNPNAMLVPMAAQTGGMAYGDARDQGLAPAQALPFAASQAMIEYATERMPGIKLLEGLQTKQPILELAKNFLAREIPGEQVATALQDLNEWATLNPDKPFTEYLKERPGAAYGTLVATVVGGGLQVGTGKAIEAVAGRFAKQDGMAEMAQQNRAALDQLDQLAAASRTRARDPESFKQFMASAVEDGPVSDVYIDAKVIADSGIAESLAQASPAVADQLADALASGGTVKIPFDEYATSIAGTELNQPLVDHIKLDPEGMTFSESEQFQKTYADEFNRQLEEANLAQQGDDNFKASTAEVRAEIKDQLNAAGHSSPAVNDTYATLASSYYAVRAAQLGISPREMYDRSPLKVVGESMSGGQFNQGRDLAGLRQQWADAGIEGDISEKGDVITLSRIVVPESERGAGKGTAAMQALIDYADSTGQHIALTPSSDFGGNKKRLTDFYKRFGFVENKGKNRAFSTSESMYRQAKGKVLYQSAIDTPEFKNWFGDSKVVDAEGKPLVVYHGTHADFSAFKPNEALGGGIFFSPDPKEAGAFASVQGAKILPVYLSAKKVWPRVVRSYEEVAAINKAKAAGYDAVRVRDSADGVVNWVVFDPAQIKSATGNRGTFDPNDPNILNQGNRGSYAPTENTISLLKNADLSTFLHELGHAFLAMDTDLAYEIAVNGATTDGQQQILDDAATLFSWFGIKGDLTEQLNTWRALGIDGQRQYHEKFAEGFEAYLFTGKSPRLDLQPIFQRFRAWLADVYRNLQSYLQAADESLTPEVRSVMDRMIADSEQIRIAQQARGMAPLFTLAEEAGMTPDAFTQYQQDSTQASLDAISELEAKSMRDMTWSSRLREKTVVRLNRQANALRKEVRKDVEAEVDQEPVYAAMRFLKRGEINGQEGKVTEGHKLSIPALEQLYTGENPPDWKKLGYGAYGMLSSEGIHPDLAAQMFGFASGDDLVRSILDAQPRNAVIDALTDQRMLEQHGELATPDAINRAADAAIHNDVRTRMIATELAGLQKALGSALTLSRMAKDYARQVVGRTKVKELRPNKFATDAARAGKNAEAAMRKGDRDTAVTEKRNQLINHATTKAAYEAQDEVKTIVQRFRKIATTKVDNLKNSHNMDLVNAARAVLAEYGVGARGQSPREYLDLVKEYDPELYAALEPDLLMAQQQARALDQLTVDELRALSDQVESIWYLARREKQMEVDGKLVDRDTIVNELSQRLDELGMPARTPGEGQAVTEAEKRGRYLRGLRAALRRVENWVDRMDGGSITGKFRSYIFTPISEAADNYRKDATDAVRRFRDLLKGIEPSLTPGRISAPELNYTFGFSKGDAGMSELLHAIAHTGNESNKRKLLLGRNWATELPDGTLDTQTWDRFIDRMIQEGKLTKAHFDFVQGVWDLLEDLKPLAQRTHREVFGRYFAEVTADAFTNQFGTYRGGYLPAITDTFEVQDAAINAALDEVNQGNAYMFPAANRGFTKARVEYNRPLALDLRLLPQHIDKVLLFSHMEPHVRDVQRVLKGVGGKLNRYDPVAYTDLLLPWLNRAAKQTVETPIPGWAGKASRIFSVVRSRAGMATMFANLTNALQQVTGFSITLLKVKPTYLRQAMGQYIKSPSAMAEAAAALSPFMADRLENQTFHLRDEIEDLLLNPNKYEQTKAWTTKHAYILQSTFQNVVDTITWTGAYNQALAENMSEVEAIRSANSAVRETQGSLKPEDISRFETGTAFTRMFTQFASYFNMQANVLGTEFAKISQEVGLRKGAGRAFYVLLFGFLAPAWAAEAIVLGMRGGGGDGDDEYLDEFLSFFFGAPLRNAAAMVPIVGPAVLSSAAGFNSNLNDDRLANAPAITSIEASVRAPSSVYKAMFENGRASRAVKDSLSLITMITGVPVSALGRPAGYMADVAEGRTEPTDAVDLTRGLVTGTSSPDSKR